MSGTKRISALTELASGSVDEDDILAIVDMSQASVVDKTKHVKVKNLIAVGGRLEIDSFAELATKFVSASPSSTQQIAATNDIVVWREKGFRYQCVTSGEHFDYTGSGGLKWKALPGPQGHSALAFNADNSGVVDATTALNAWADAMRADGVTGVLRGTFATTGAVDLSNTRIWADATIVPTGSFEAVQWKASAGALYEYQACIGMLRVHWASADWTEDRTAFAIQNSYNGRFDIGWENATRGLWMHGNGASGRGCVYNEVNFGVCYMHNVGVHLSSENSSGWCNANRFIGGRFYGGASVTGSLYETTAGHIWIDASSGYDPNGNVFIFPSLEWNGAGFRLARMDGLRNRLTFGYAELDSGDTTWVVDTGTENTIDCENVPYVIGYDPTLAGPANRVDVSGATRPTVLGAYGYRDNGGTTFQRIIGNSSTRAPLNVEQANSAGPVLTLQNTGGSSGPALRIITSDDHVSVSISALARSWKVKANSGGTINKSVLWTENVAPTTETWVRGDIAWMTNPSAGGPAGWICTVGGTPGTWQPFGMIKSSAVYTTSNVTTDRTFDADSTTLDEIADVLGTLIADLKAGGLLT